MKVITKRQQWWKRPLAVMLAVALVMSSFAMVGVPQEVQAEGNTFYVSSTGDDTNNDGTEGAPFATIGKAFEAVDETTPGTIILLSDITLNEELSLSKGENPAKSVTIQSKENEKHSIIRATNLTGVMIRVNNSGGTVVFKDLIIDGNNVQAVNHGVYNTYTNTTFENVELKNHHIAGGAGTTVISSYGNGSIVTITGNTVIKDNTISNSYESNPPSILGAGTKGVLVIEGGTITNNEVIGESNGVIVGIGLYQTPRFRMTGGTITGNKLLGNEVNAAGETVGNVAVYMRGSSSQARFEFGGTAFVYDNLNANNEQRNVFLKNVAARDNAFLSLVEPGMADGAKVGVYANIMPSNDEPIVDLAIGYGGYEATVSDAVYFESDKATSAIVEYEESSKKVILIPLPPEFKTAGLKQTTVDGNQITLTFNDGIDLISNDLSGFKIEVGGVDVTADLQFEIDVNDARKLIFTLPTETDITNKNITIDYNKVTGTENLKGKNGMPVENFTFVYEYQYVDALDITDPSGDPAQVSVATPEIKGTAEAGSTVTVVIKDEDGNIVTGAGGTANVDASGNWNFTVSDDLIHNNTYTVEVTATSGDGKTAITKTKDIKIALPAPELDTAELEQTAADGNKITLMFDQEVEWTDLDGFTIKVGDDNVTMDDVTFAFDPNDETKLILTLPTGTDVTGKDVKVSYDGTGNLKGKNGVPVSDFNMNVEDPFAAALKITEPSGNPVTEFKPKITGTAEAGSVMEIVIKDGAGNPIANAGGTVTADGDGNWTFTPAEGLADGTYTIEATATKDGKISTKEKEITVAIPAPIVMVTAPADEIVSTSKPTFSGTATAGATIEVKITDDVTLTTTADENGNWSVTPDDDLSDDTYNVVITAIKDGKSSAPINKTVKVDTTLPELKIAEPSSDKVFEAKPTFKGTADADATLTAVIKDKGGKVIDTPTVTVNADGTWSFTPETELPDGDYTVEVTATKDGKSTTETKDIIVDTSEPTPTPSVDKTALQALVTDTNDELDDDGTLKEADYTPASWQALQAKLKEAEAVLKDPQATQTKVDQAFIDLATALNNLVPVQVPDAQAPQVVTAEVYDPASDKLVLTFDKAITLTDANGFSLIGSKGDITVTDSVYDLSVDGRTLTLTLDRDVEPGETLTLSYNENNGSIIAVVGEQPLASFTRRIVTNQVQPPQSHTGELNALGLTYTNGNQLGTNPAFDPGTGTYTATVSNGTTQISINPETVETGTSVKVFLNGQEVALSDWSKLPLQVGKNTIKVNVYDQDGNILKTYTIEVTRQSAPSGGSSGSSGGGGSTPGQSNTETIEVDVVIGGDNPADITKVPIERITHADGTKTDQVTFTPEKAQEAIEKAAATGEQIARIVIPDEKDEVSEVHVDVPQETVESLQESDIDLEIYIENAIIHIPNSSLEGLADDFYFHLVPVKEEDERREIEERARVEEVVRVIAGNDDIDVVARPMTIETNLSSRPVTLTLPLRDVTLPSDAVERERYLRQLGIFIEHSDGEKEVVSGQVVTLADGTLGLQFSINKFSTFTIIHFAGELIDMKLIGEQIDGEHVAFIKGFPDGMFKPNEAVTRAQVAIMVARNLGYVDRSQESASVFNDLPQTHYAAGAIHFIYNAGIMVGDKQGNFRANDPITRAEMATVIANYQEFQIEEDVATSFSDTQGHWAEWIIEANRQEGMITGYEDGTFRPNAHLTRAEATVMINRMFARGPLYGISEPSFPDVATNHWAFEHIEEAARDHHYQIDANNMEWMLVE